MRLKFFASACAISGVVLMTGCGPSAPLVGGVPNPLTPEQARAQAIDAAKQVLEILGLQPDKVIFAPAACKDNGGGPYRGSVIVHYPLAPTYDISQGEIEEMAQRLRAAGWGDDSEFRSHSQTVHKDGVTVMFQPQGAGAFARIITVYGECRDTTTTWETRGPRETLPIPLAP